MDPPMIDIELVPEKEKIEDGKEGGPTFHCDLYDADLVRRIAQVFLPGLSAACVDNTTGGIFRSPASVAVEMRKEMIEYLTMRSETFVAETIILEGGQNEEISDHPYDIISDFVDDFASSKRNFFSRVQGWILSEKREDKIDDFVQEMEVNGFWLSDRREVIAQNLVKNVDYKNIFYCDKKFYTAEELAEHVINCDFRTVNCTNDGCVSFFCASQLEKHDSTCPFKIIPCEQKCSDHIMRREMDRHCITVCPMKLVNCPFYAVGCPAAITRSMIQQHCLDDLNSHLVYALKNIHKEASEEDLKDRLDQIMQASSGQLQAARDARALTKRVRDLDAKLGPLVITKKIGEESADDSDNITDRFIEVANENTDSSVEAANDVTNKSTDAATNVTEKSLESSNDAIVKSTKASTEVIEKLSEASDEATEKSIEASNDITERSFEAPKEVTEKSIEASNDVTEKSVEALDDVTENTEASNNVADKSTEAASDVSDKSTGAANDVSEDSNESTNEHNGKSTEAADDITDKTDEEENGAIEESSQAGIGVTEKSTYYPNKFGDESLETSNLIADAEKEPQTQA
ncbi:hypothetical protein JCGZ_03049 [Jatropha curcas]|uniref:TRAF-type domain-containing protein n=1 Tax=Jatropha curcas TaxID=180498 RepID=A0A067JDH3_JATCU|nr:uncharacterized protein LOC105648960 [Jatropha curcas]KDP21911.1 hypothetical protein JCGZ_03049 [Jatropha curcas]